MDKLDEIFSLQEKLSIKTNENNPRYESRLAPRISQLCTAIIHEATELQDTTNWKWWKKEKQFNFVESRVELVDIWHFVIQASLELGLTPTDLLNEYKKKNNVNLQRQRDGY